MTYINVLKNGDKIVFENQKTIENIKVKTNLNLKQFTPIK